MRSVRYIVMVIYSIVYLFFIGSVVQAEERVSSQVNSTGEIVFFEDTIGSSNEKQIDSVKSKIINDTNLPITGETVVSYKLICMYFILYVIFSIFLVKFSHMKGE